MYSFFVQRFFFLTAVFLIVAILSPNIALAQGIGGAAGGAGSGTGGSFGGGGGGIGGAGGGNTGSGTGGTGGGAGGGSTGGSGGGGTGGGTGGTGGTGGGGGGSGSGSSGGSGAGGGTGGSGGSGAGGSFGGGDVGNSGSGVTGGGNPSSGGGVGDAGSSGLGSTPSGPSPSGRDSSTISSAIGSLGIGNIGRSGITSAATGISSAVSSAIGARGSLGVSSVTSGLTGQSSITGAASAAAIGADTEQEGMSTSDAEVSDDSTTETQTEEVDSLTEEEIQQMFSNFVDNEEKEVTRSVTPTQSVTPVSDVPKGQSTTVTGKTAVNPDPRSSYFGNDVISAPTAQNDIDIDATVSARASGSIDEGQTIGKDGTVSDNSRTGATSEVDVNPSVSTDNTRGVSQNNPQAESYETETARAAMQARDVVLGAIDKAVNPHPAAVREGLKSATQYSMAALQAERGEFDAAVASIDAAEDAREAMSAALAAGAELGNPTGNSNAFDGSPEIGGSRDANADGIADANQPGTNPSDIPGAYPAPTSNSVGQAIANAASKMGQVAKDVIAGLVEMLGAPVEPTVSRTTQEAIDAEKQARANEALAAKDNSRLGAPTENTDNDEVQVAFDGTYGPQVNPGTVTAVPDSVAFGNENNDENTTEVAQSDPQENMSTSPGPLGATDAAIPDGEETDEGKTTDATTPPAGEESDDSQLADVDEPDAVDPSENTDKNPSPYGDAPQNDNDSEDADENTDTEPTAPAAPTAPTTPSQQTTSARNTNETIASMERQATMALMDGDYRGLGQISRDISEAKAAAGIPDTGVFNSSGLVSGLVSAISNIGLSTRSGVTTNTQTTVTEDPRSSYFGRDQISFSNTSFDLASMFGVERADLSDDGTVTNARGEVIGYARSNEDGTYSVTSGPTPSTFSNPRGDIVDSIGFSLGQLAPSPFSPFGQAMIAVANAVTAPMSSTLTGQRDSSARIGNVVSDLAKGVANNLGLSNIGRGGTNATGNISADLSGSDYGNPETGTQSANRTPPPARDTTAVGTQAIVNASRNSVILPDTVEALANLDTSKYISLERVSVNGTSYLILEKAEESIANNDDDITNQVVPVVVVTRKENNNTVTYLESPLAIPSAPNLDSSDEPVSLITDDEGNILFSDGRFAPATNGNVSARAYEYYYYDESDLSEISNGTTSTTGSSSEVQSNSPNIRNFLSPATWIDSISKSIVNIFGRFTRGGINYDENNEGFNDLTSIEIEDNRVNSVTAYKPINGIAYEDRDILRVEVEVDQTISCLDTARADTGFNFYISYFAVNRAKNAVETVFTEETLCGQGGGTINFADDIARHLKQSYNFSEQITPSALEQKITLYNSQ